VAEIDDIAALLSRMTVLEAMALVKRLEAAWHIEPAPAAPVVPAPSGFLGEDAGTYEFSVVLRDPGERRLEVIALVRELAGLGLKEARDLVASAPRELFAGLEMPKAKRLVERFAELGASLELR
jgi:large subunit ribosomal protein L7/L12